MSLGVQYQRRDGRDGVGLELGVYAFLGVIGLQVLTVVEPEGRPQTFITFALRYF